MQPATARSGVRHGIRGIAPARDTTPHVEHERKQLDSSHREGFDHHVKGVTRNIPKTTIRVLGNVSNTAAADPGCRVDGSERFCLASPEPHVTAATTSGVTTTSVGPAAPGLAVECGCAAENGAVRVKATGEALSL